ncbi:MAG TPA: hypothetical protein PKA05_15870 [Roseiflexaceae bacterium]|nr:hypothetical protein [Roseiflexaceae bacterium]
MPDFLESLIARNQGSDVVRPRPIARFAAGTALDEIVGEVATPPAAAAPVSPAAPAGVVVEPERTAYLAQPLPRAATEPIGSDPPAALPRVVESPLPPVVQPAMARVTPPPVTPTPAAMPSAVIAPAVIPSAIVAPVSPTTTDIIHEDAPATAAIRIVAEATSAGVPVVPREAVLPEGSEAVRPQEVPPAAAPPVITITIGRIEVRPRSPAAPPPAPRRGAPLSLDSYLRRRDGGET